MLPMVHQCGKHLSPIIFQWYTILFCKFFFLFCFVLCDITYSDASNKCINLSNLCVFGIIVSHKNKQITINKSNFWWCVYWKLCVFRDCWLFSILLQLQKGKNRIVSYVNLFLLLYTNLWFCAKVFNYVIPVTVHICTAKIRNGICVPLISLGSMLFHCFIKKEKRSHVHGMEMWRAILRLNAPERIAREKWRKISDDQKELNIHLHSKAEMREIQIYHFQLYGEKKSSSE